MSDARSAGEPGGRQPGLEASGGDDCGAVVVVKAAREITVKWNYDAASKQVAFIHLECEGRRYCLEVAYQGYREQPWQIGHRNDWHVSV